MTGVNLNRVDELPDSYTEVIEDFAEFKQSTGKDTETVDTYLNRVTCFFEWLTRTTDSPPEPEEITMEHTKQYNNWAASEYASATYRHRIITLNDMFNVVSKLDASIWDRPVASVPNSQEVRDSQTLGRGLDDSDLSEFLLSIKHPQWHAFFLLLAKSMLRVQEARNIRLSEVHISDPEIDQLYDDLDISHHSKVAHSPDSIYIPADREGNKRKTATRIPIDDELKAALIRWLTVRPVTEESIVAPKTLFVSLGDNWGEPLPTQTVNQEWNDYVPESWRPDDNPMTPHDLRHWTNRKLRPVLQEACLAYLRGDSPDIRDHYDNILSEYEERVRTPYLRHVPKFYS